MRTVLLVALVLITLSVVADESHIRQAGYLVIHGGGESPEPLAEFVRLAGGSSAKNAVIPTAAGRDSYDEQFQANYFRPFRELGVVNIRLLHTSNRSAADSDDFVSPLMTATGVWFTGGRQWRIADVYLDTKTESALWTLLARGGVIGGGSAGATIQGSYLVRGDSRGALIPMGDHEEGFGFLENSAIDQHLLARNRHFDLVTVVRSHPQLLGLGLDADAGIVVHGDEFRVIGNGYVAVYDPKLILANGAFYFMEKGQRFRLSTRTPMSADGQPLWLPHLQPRVTLTPADLREAVGTYRVGEATVTVRMGNRRLHVTPCAEDERELVPLSRDIFYDSADGSKFTMQRNEYGTVTGLTWQIERNMGQRRCGEGTVQAVKVLR